VLISGDEINGIAIVEAKAFAQDFRECDRSHPAHTDNMPFDADHSLYLLSCVIKKLPPLRDYTRSGEELCWLPIQLLIYSYNIK